MSARGKKSSGEMKVEDIAGGSFTPEKRRCRRIFYDEIVTDSQNSNSSVVGDAIFHVDILHQNAYIIYFRFQLVRGNSIPVDVVESCFVEYKFHVAMKIVNFRTTSE